jgi:hypothetical protein
MKYAGSVPLMEVRLSQPHNENATMYTIQCMCIIGNAMVTALKSMRENHELMECMITVALLLYRPWFRVARIS